MAFVIKRNGQKQEVSFDKVFTRIKKLSTGLQVNAFEITQAVCSRIYDGVTTAELDEIASNLCSSLITKHPDYNILASRLVISNNHKLTTNDFREIIDELYHNTDIHNENNPLVHKILYDCVQQNHEIINKTIDYQRDYNFDFFGYKTLERSYLIKINSKVIERPQHMYMRLSLGIHMDIKTNIIDLPSALETYNTMSKQYYTHATPTLFNSGTYRNQQSSCYLLDMTDDSVTGIFKTLSDCAHISKHAGGIGLALHKIRSKNQLIRGTNGRSDGVLPLLKTYNATAKYINQCFVPETIIYTNNGIKQIKDIVVGNDSVITNDGTYKTVLDKIVNNVDKDILEIKTTLGFETIKVTNEHQLYVVKNISLDEINDNRNKLGGVIQAKFISASELQINDLVVYPLKHPDNISRDYLINFMKKYPEMNDMFITDDYEEAQMYKYIMYINGIITTGTYTNGKYILKHAHNNQYFIFKNQVWAAIESIQTIHYEGQVYDLNIMDNHNYVVGSFGLVHNSGKRNGSFACYLETHHPDIFDFLDAKKNHGAEDERARDLFYALWVSNLFMKRVEEDGIWSLMDPDICPGLYEVYGEEYEKLYLKYEDEKRYTKQIQARELWFKIMDSQIETGTPYILFKDNVNNKTNHKNFGTTKSSNLCVHPDTLILTDKGHLPIGTLQDTNVNVWNGKEWSDVEVKKTGENQKLLKITFNNESSIKCTYYHKFYIETHNGEIKEYQAYELKKGMKLIKYTYPTVQFDDIFAQHGLISNTDNDLLRVYVKNIDKIEELSDTYCVNEPKEHKVVFNGILTGNCAEITQFTDKDQTAVCNLASICLPKYIKYDSNGNKIYDYELLGSMVRIIVRNINKIIDNNFNPTPECEYANQQQRPMGIGVQGLADVFMMLDIPFDCNHARELNKKIFETIYYYAISESAEIAKTNGSYPRYENSPFSKGILQFDMWKYELDNSRYNWSNLKETIKTTGIRNSLLTALMPTASTSQICGFTESFEPVTSMLYKRKTLAGEFVVINKYLCKKLIELNLWNEEMKNKIIIADGSIQHINEIPLEIRHTYRTIWEIPQKSLIEMSADRGVFIDQSQSFNLWFAEPTYAKITSALFLGWKLGLKTGSYYLRSKPKSKTQQFTIDPTLEKNNIIGNKNEKEVNQDKKTIQRKEEEKKEQQEFSRLFTEFGLTKQEYDMLPFMQRKEIAKKLAQTALFGEEDEGCLMCSG